MADEVVSHAFSHGYRSDHSERLATYWSEALGGPTAYTERFGDESFVVRLHSGNGEHEEMNERAIACFDQALADVGLADDDRLRQVLHDYWAWTTTTTMYRYHDSADDVPDGLTMPKWSWDGPCLDGDMTTPGEEQRVISAAREITAPAATIFEMIADPARQPEWDGNDNLREAGADQRVRAVGDVFTMTIHNGQTRENHVVEFEEGRRIAWCPADPGQPPAGHLWRWQLEPIDDATTKVTHTYDWSGLHDERRVQRAQSTTADSLRASIDRLADLAEGL